MHLRVLGCHGGESTIHRTTCFLIDERLLVDAGAATRGLTLQQQCEIENVLVSHSHLDHIRDLALLADNIIGVRPKPLDIFCTAGTADTLERHFFNNLVWPDFTRITNPADPQRGPVLRLQRMQSGSTVQVGPFEVTTVPVSHPVESHALFIADRQTTLAYSSDTGPTELLWQKLNTTQNLKAFIFETSFPNNMQALADVSGHLTPQGLQQELKKLTNHSHLPILLYHLKPGFHEELTAQIAALGDARLRILSPMDEFTF